MTPPSDATDAELVAAAAAGDERAFTALMRRHKEPVYRLLRHLTGDADEALDLLQETFAGLWRALPRYDPARPFAAWARRAALNRARDWGRKRSVRRLFVGWLPGLDDGSMARADDKASPETMVGDALVLRAVERAIAALPAKLREALVLTAIEGLSQAAAAELLGVTEKTIETRVYRARQRLTALAANPF